MIVVDTNLIAYLLIETEQTEGAVLVRRRDRDWIAPPLWRSELSNVLMLYLRRSGMTLEKAVLVIKFAETKVQSRAVDPERVIELAFDSGCTAYDCEFVSLAERLGVPLVTSDKEVLKAFPDIAVSIRDFAAV